MGILTVVALVMGISGSVPAGRATGEIRAAGAPLGDFSVKVATCYSSGDLWSSDVWLITRLERPLSGRVGFTGGLHVLESGTGKWRAVVESPRGCNGFKCPQRPLDEKDCRVFELFSEAGGWWWRRSGHARLDCTFPEGGTLKADLTFRGCAHPFPASGDP